NLLLAVSASRARLSRRRRTLGSAPNIVTAKTVDATTRPRIDARSSNIAKANMATAVHIRRTSPLSILTQVPDHRRGAARNDRPPSSELSLDLLLRERPRRPAGPLVRNLLGTRYCTGRRDESEDWSDRLGLVKH